MSGEVLFAIIVIGWIISAVTKGKKKQQASRPGQNAQQAKDAAAGKPAAGQAKKTATTYTWKQIGDEIIKSINAAGEQQKKTETPVKTQSAPAPSREGAARVDEAGCVGGSLPHDRHEGTARVDEAGCVGGSLPHATHEGAPSPMPSANRNRNRRPEDAAQRRPAASGAHAGITANRMRDAVILSEILGAPVSRRPRRIAR